MWRRERWSQPGKNRHDPAITPGDSTMTTLYRTQPGAMTERDAYFFDLYGYVIITGALSETQLAGCNAIVDGLQHLRPGDWSGAVHGHSYGIKDGINLQQIF